MADENKKAQVSALLQKPAGPKPTGPAQGRSADSTSMFQIGSELEMEDLRLPATSNKMMEKVREIFDPGKWMPLEPNLSGIIFANFAKNIRGCAAVTLQSKRTPEQKDTFFIVTTRKNVWLVYSTPHETLHDHYEALMNVNLKLRTIIEERPPGYGLDPVRQVQGSVDAEGHAKRGGETMKKRYVSHLSSSDLRNFYATASVYRVQEPAAKRPELTEVAQAIDSLAPPGPEMNVNMTDTQRKIGMSSLVISSKKGFSLKEFADSIKFVATFTDEFGRPHYFIIAGEDETVYRLYINGKVAPSPGVVGFTRFKYCNDVCVMYQEG